MTPAKKTGGIKGLPENDPAATDDMMSARDNPSVADTNEVNVTPDDDDTEYEFVRMPNGSIRPVPKDDIREAPTTSTQDAVVTEQKPKEDMHFYVHLADGSVERVKESDLPMPAGSNAVHGFWQREGKLYTVIGVYPVEDNVGKE